MISLRTFHILHFNYDNKNWTQKLNTLFSNAHISSREKTKELVLKKINTTFLEYNFPLPLESISFEMSIKIMIWKHRRQHQKINGFITTHINAQIIEISWILLTDKKPSSFRNSVFFGACVSAQMINAPQTRK